MYHHPNVPPAPPPKPAAGDVAPTGTPGAMAHMAPQLPSLAGVQTTRESSTVTEGGQQHHYQGQRQQEKKAENEDVPDPGDSWLPLFLQDKSKQDLEVLLRTSTLLNALANSPSTIHPSLGQSYQTVSAALHENIRTASELLDLENQLAHQRASAQAQLLSAHALERQWQQKQRDVDMSLYPFSPSALYQTLGQGLQDQEAMCRSLEDSFLDGGFAAANGHDGVASEREVSEWTRSYRDQKKLYYLRRERKARWDEGRVGGWR
ncbi:uncharacterized protein MKZ38_006468 [Zalerion maritima]|uniref:VPS37 C-terminal domain-containing protein n=1 Tax=Zalerion maritima TaxID=339359 RepID=A0AAD5RVG3_9PEZI|nr:uncharacterized protein MKZ38_006468 [Zalerion maritima]